MRTLGLMAIAACLAACGPSETANKAPEAGPAKPQAAGAPPAASGPFGIAMGTPIARLSLAPAKEGDPPGFYLLSKPPKPHPAFDEGVAVIAFPETGVCMVRAFGRDLDNDQFGLEVRGLVDGVAEQLATKYGPGEKSDFCIDRYCSNQYWAQELAASGRTYGYGWKSTAEKPLPEQVKELVVAARANNSFNTYIVIEYAFSNHDQCKELQKKAAASAL